jgi:transposase
MFEDTGKRGMFVGSRRRNREISAVDWKQLSNIVEYKATANSVSSWGTTMICPRCGAKNIVPPVADAEISCWCGLVRNRQRGAAFNIWLKGNGLFPR